MSEFSDRPLVVGSITGLRSFNVDSLGRLVGVAHPKVWQPGVNEAVCRVNGAPMTTKARQRTSAEELLWTMRTFGARSAIINAPAEERGVCLVKHHVAAVQCTCGFYAYFDRETNPYTEHPVQAVVRGYGAVTVGSRGFRASKAEIVCFIDREPEPWWKRVTGFGWVNLAVMLITFTNWLTMVLAGQPLWITAIAGGVFGFTIPTRLLSRRLRALPPRYLRSNGSRIPEKVRHAYPGVPVVAGIDAALAEFPLTPPRAPSPADLDFWTRSAS